MMSALLLGRAKAPLIERDTAGKRRVCRSAQSSASYWPQALWAACCLPSMCRRRRRSTARTSHGRGPACPRCRRVDRFPPRAQRRTERDTPLQEEFTELARAPKAGAEARSNAKSPLSRQCEPRDPLTAQRDLRLCELFERGDGVNAREAARVILRCSEHLTNLVGARHLPTGIRRAACGPRKCASVRSWTRSCR